MPAPTLDSVLARSQLDTHGSETGKYLVIKSYVPDIYLQPEYSIVKHSQRKECEVPEGLTYAADQSDRFWIRDVRR